MLSTLSANTAASLRRAVQEQGLPQEFLEGVMACHLPLAETIAVKRRGKDGPLWVSINGPQGSGKSTLADFLARLLREEFALAPVVLSLDDFYLPRPQRLQRAERIHPLFATRGVPGTHDVELAMQLFAELEQAGPETPLSLPRFDKAADERCPPTQWPRLQERPDVILFEGWCNHCPPQSERELVDPLNELEEREDPRAVWRRSVNDFLSDYHHNLFRPPDLLLYLRIPSFDRVLQWRGLQERKLKQRLGPDAGMNEAQLRRFIRHYERLTRHGMKTLPDQADAVLDLDDEHRAAGLRIKPSNLDIVDQPG